ncbi:MAG: ABC transporter ATP-binding protein [Actinobacteria bacterium]|nr:ABC transporter ATP-binding protein [Actinomycetota bacterium]
MSLFEADQITKKFAGIHALNNVSMSVDAGELVGLIGPNGAGKTTFFNCVNGITKPDCGRVTFDGRDITRMQVYRRARLGFARTFQRVELFDGMTVRDHLIVASRAHSRKGNLLKDLLLLGRTTAEERAVSDQMLDLLGLTDAADRPIESVTLGQGRLVELGRALMTDPKLLFLDEPSSGLDEHETIEAANTLLRVQREHGTAIVLVDHDVATVERVCSRLFVLDYGTVIASGATAEVLADERVRTAYLGANA